MFSPNHHVHIDPACFRSMSPRLCTIHNSLNNVNDSRSKMGKSALPYKWVAEGDATKRSRIVNYWNRVERVARQRALDYMKAARAAAVAPVVTPTVSAPAPSSSDAWACIALHEEGGHNSVAGYFGFIYAPSSYIDPAPAIAAQYGNSWLSIPYAAQLQIAEALQAKYGWSPWSTAPGCGL